MLEPTNYETDYNLCYKPKLGQANIKEGLKFGNGLVRSWSDTSIKTGDELVIPTEDGLVCGRLVVNPIRI